MTEALFRVRKPDVTQSGFRAYWMESTAPLNIDDDNEKPDVFPGTVELKPDEAIQEIAEYLNSCEAPQIVISVHGFNNPFKVVKDRFTEAYAYLTGDQVIRDSPGLVCIGYRWPSEAMGTPKDSVFEAAPRSLLWIFGVALCLLIIGAGLALPFFRGLFGRNALHSLLYGLGSLLVAVPLTAFLLRLVVYFRDNYRALNYGVPDLLEVLRHLDLAANTRTPGRVRDPNVRIKLSFIGHSMGSLRRHQSGADYV